MMTVPLVVLAVLSVGAGFLNVAPGTPLVGSADGHAGMLEHALMGSREAPVWFDLKKAGVEPEVFHGWVAVWGTLSAALGILVAWAFYGKKLVSPDAFVAQFGPLHRLVVNKYYFDDVYLWLVRSVQQRIAELCSWFENTILVKGIVNGLAALTRWFGGQIRLLLDGHLHTYVTLALGGVFFILALVLSAR